MQQVYGGPKVWWWVIAALTVVAVVAIIRDSRPTNKNAAGAPESETQTIVSVLTEIYKLQQDYYNTNGFYYKDEGEFEKMVLEPYEGGTGLIDLFSIPDFGIIENKTPYTIIISVFGDGKRFIASAFRNPGEKQPGVAYVDQTGKVTVHGDTLR